MTGLDALGAAFDRAGAAAWGGLPYAALTPLMDAAAQEKAHALLPHPTAVLVAAFPYFTGETEGNLSLYARGEDYHGVLRRRLDTVCDFLREEYSAYSFSTLVDSSPLPEREAAWRAGLGLRGKNHLFILPPYGSYVFLGTILTDAPLPLAEAESAPDCMGCNRCLSACPSGALTLSHMRQCLSDISQKKGALTPEGESLLKAHPLIWGCDTCQSVCPYNHSPKIDPLPEFTHEYCSHLTPQMLAGLSNRAFARAFGHRAFAWRGPEVLRRNLRLKGE